MATGRTISASFLTQLDRDVLNLCAIIGETITAHIPEDSRKKDFNKQYAKISNSRDGGLGLGGGKLQRDAVCTRGRQGKAPFSNRNLRWHPLIVAEEQPSFAKKIKRIEISGENEMQVLVFVIEENGKEIEYPSDKVQNIKDRHVALPEHWFPHVDILKNWNDGQWTQNSCIIPASEACDWQDSLETYAILGIALAVSLYGTDFDTLYPEIKEVLGKQEIADKIKLPSKKFPKNKEIINCSVCLKEISSNLNEFRVFNRGKTWQPNWKISKRQEGNDSSLQIMHINPLVEREIRHDASNVRYGHRWCNIAMSDHSLEETLDFMNFVIKAHKDRS